MSANIVQLRQAESTEMRPVSHHVGREANEVYRVREHLTEAEMVRLLAKATVPGPRSHALRHSTGYALAGRGMDTRRLQHYLGHASITDTVRYTAISPEPFKDIWR
jgi:site-specific recombinase XerD